MDPKITSWVPTEGIAMKGEEAKKTVASHRKSFERRWYDNNFFDDGYHFRYVSRTTNKVVDLTDKSQSNVPHRAIPKASRQIRGVANLLLQPEYRPVVYPERVSKYSFQDPKEYAKAVEVAKQNAKRIGNWITYEWDRQELKEKLIHMVLLAAKHGVSYLKMIPDVMTNQITSYVRDAFDVYLVGTLSSIYDSPFIIESTPTLINQIIANEAFDENQRMLLVPDNKFADSEIKQAYMQARFQMGTLQSDQSATVLLNEGFFKEYITQDNIDSIFPLLQDGMDLDGKKIGDTIIRHSFWAGKTWLKDEYIDLPDYPYVDYRFEPGPIYQVPLIERFIPANKTLDILSSRIERYANTMVTGAWLTRKGENLEITNVPGGQKIEYSGIPPVQANIANIPPFMFNFMQFIDNIISEQGVNAAIGDTPSGVKSGVAIEAVKATEYANLKTPGDMLKKTTKTICKKMIDIGSKYFIDPQTVYLLEKDKPDYFDVIGERGYNVRQQMPFNEEMQDTVVLKYGCPVDVEVETGLGFTMEGRRNTMQQINDFILNMTKEGLINPQAAQVIMGKFLETYNFGATQDFMDALEEGGMEAQVAEDQITKMKVGLAEVLKDVGMTRDQMEKDNIDQTKVAVAEVLKDAGFNNKKEEPENKGPSRSISFKDLPPDGKVQLAAQAGIEISPDEAREMDELAKVEKLSQVVRNSQPKPNGKQNGQSA